MEKKSVQELVQDENTKSYEWYKFYNYGILPIQIIWNLYLLMYSNAISFIIFLAFIVIKIVLFFSMIYKKQFTLKLLSISIYSECLLYIILFVFNMLEDMQDITKLIVSAVMIIIISAWMMSNISYFEKREEIFKN